MSLRSVMNEVRPKFEHATGHTLAIEFTTPREIEKRIQDRETADVAIGTGFIFAKGQVVPGSVTPVARSLVGVAVRKGAPKPDISSPDAIKRALLAAESVAYSRDGLSGQHVVKLFERWGIANEMKRKAVLGLHLSDLGAEIIVHAISAMILYENYDIIGPLTDELQPNTLTSAAIIAGAKNMEAAKALIDFLRTPEGVAVIKAKGMVPAAP